MTVSATAPGAERGTPPLGRVLLGVVLTVQFMVALDISVVNVALPDIRTGLGFGEDGLTWVVNAYALAFGGRERSGALRP